MLTFTWNANNHPLAHGLAAGAVLCKKVEMICSKITIGTRNRLMARCLCRSSRSTYTSATIQANSDIEPYRSLYGTLPVNEAR